MKTGKQIELERNKKGTEQMQEYEDFDRISVDVVTLEEKVPVEFFNEKSVLVVPIIKSGVLELYNSDVEEDEVLSDYEYLYNTDRGAFLAMLDKGMKLKGRDLMKRVVDQSYKHRIIRLFFDAEMEDENVIFEMTQISSMPVYKEIVVSSGLQEYQHFWDFTMKIMLPMRVTNGEYQVEVKEFADATCVIYEKQKRNKDEIERYMQKLIGQEELDLYPMETFLKIMGYLNFIMEHPELKELGEQKKRSRTSGNKKTSEPTQKKSEEKAKMREISLNGILMRTSNQKVANTMRSRQIHRVATCWGVRGHFRHYKKTGKVVYIEPYEKGKDAGKRIKKHYKL
ncbi:MAG: hypothetical protein J6A75_13475 [Lachnospiraceae bacterium]|nr:hypothetical protein [Lachnospiraceae bacterium]